MIIGFLEKGKLVSLEKDNRFNYWKRKADETQEHEAAKKHLKVFLIDPAAS